MIILFNDKLTECYSYSVGQKNGIPYINIDFDNDDNLLSEWGDIIKTETDNRITNEDEV